MNFKAGFQFSKYSGCGNDFIIIDNRDSLFPTERSIIQNLCLRQQGIGADGLILLENSRVADFKMRIFNADGSEAEMCGNGIRCLVKFYTTLTSANKNLRVETKEKILQAFLEKDNVCIHMSDPCDIFWNRVIKLSSQNVTLDFLNTGVPHAILFIDDLEKIDVKILGKEIRYHPAFGSAGTNVNFVKRENENEISMRTYERGVENETLACGTGATAAAIAAAHRYGTKNLLNVRTRSGEVLKIHFGHNESGFHSIRMEGLASFIFTGFFKIDDLPLKVKNNFH